MRKSLLLILFILIISCSKEDNTNLNEKLLKAISVQSAVSAKSFVESNEELEVKLDLAQPEIVESLTDTEIAKLKAAVYRFYSTVTVKDDTYYTPLKNGEEINISKDLFKVFKKNLDQMNQNINALKAEEGEVEVQEVTSEYLDSLLK